MGNRRAAAREGAERQIRDGGAPPPGASATEWGRSGLTSIAKRIALAAVEGFLSDRNESGEVVPPDPLECRRVVQDFGLSIGATSMPLRLGIHALLGAMELLPVAVVRQARRMSRLPLADRVRYLQALEDSEVGLLVVVLVGIKIPLTLSAFEEGRALRMTGFDRPSTTAGRARSVGVVQDGREEES